ncbi:MAG: PEP-CTERM sorting domain-containing protein [Marinicaulis sp.]|nr:PEP-CTERM sorting domain-containing protein [Marinicaulis sp.]
MVPPGEQPCDDIPDNDIPDCDEPMDPEEPPTDVPEPGIWVLMLTAILIYVVLEKREIAKVHLRK